MYQAQQRGVLATTQLLEGLVDGLQADHPNAVVYVVDLLPSRILVCKTVGFHLVSLPRVDAQSEV